MKETPIIFSTDMVKAILDGRATMTRRPLSPLVKLWRGQQPLEIMPTQAPNEWIALMRRDPNKGVMLKCRYGQVGDRLWVRETFRPAWAVVPGVLSGSGIQYKADGVTHGRVEALREYPECQFGECKWRSSRFIFRWASRILLEITELRVERLQEITQEDAKAEGVKPCGWLGNARLDDYKLGFRNLWNSINAKRGYGWEVNPWVWVIGFKKVVNDNL